MPITRRVVVITEQKRQELLDLAYDAGQAKRALLYENERKDILAKVAADEPDHVKRFKCLCCYYTRNTNKNKGIVCTHCDGDGIMTRLQYLNFGRAVPLTDTQRRIEVLAGALGITIPDRYKREYNANKKAGTSRTRNAP